MDPLTPTEAAMLSTASKWWSSSGALESHVRDTFDIGIVRFWQHVNALLDDPRAEAADPFATRRLQRLRAERRRSQSARHA